MPLNRLDPEGLDICHIFSKEQMEQLKCLSEGPDQEERLYRLISLWLETDESRVDTARNLTDEVIYRIWNQKGNIQVQELENATMRFQHAVRMLRNPGSISQAELALLLGYSDQAHFSRTFKKMSGITPQEFMKRHSHLILKGGPLT